MQGIKNKGTEDLKKNLTFNNGYDDINISNFSGSASFSGFYPNSEYGNDSTMSNTESSGNTSNSTSKKDTEQKNTIKAQQVWEKETSEQDNNYNFFYKEADNHLRRGAEYFNDGGANSTTIAINSHGNKKIISTPNGAMTPKELHNYLYKHNTLYRQSYDNKVTINININACKTGNGFAQELSKINPYLNVNAPTNSLLGIWNKMKDDGKWVIYNNGNLIN